MESKNEEMMLQQLFKLSKCYSKFSQMKSYCLLFSRINNCFLLVLFKFFFFGALLSPLCSLFSISLLCFLLILWWRDGTVGNELGFASISISAWWLTVGTGFGFVDLSLGIAVLDDLGLDHSWLFCMTFDFDFG